MSGDHVLGDSVEAYLRSQGHGQAVVLARVSAAWEELVGPYVAVHARPVRLRDGTLSVAVDQGAFAAQLAFLSEEILARLAEVVGAGLVTRLEATLGRT